MDTIQYRIAVLISCMAALLVVWAKRIAGFLVTFHPFGLPGEVRGKSSNQAWAASCAVAELVDRQGHNLDHLTVTSCDADTQFPKQYSRVPHPSLRRQPSRRFRPGSPSDAGVAVGDKQVRMPKDATIGVHDGMFRIAP